MAIISKTNPVGIDAVVNNLQIRLQTLVDSGSWTGYNIYPRAYKNETVNGLVPEIFTGDTSIDYREILFTDKENATSFFLMDDNMSVLNHGQRVEGLLSIIFQVNLDKIKTNTTHRADEEARYDVVRVLAKNRYSWEVTNVITGINNVYSGFNTDKIKWTDMSPYHVFRVDMTGTYPVSCKINTNE